MTAVMVEAAEATLAEEPEGYECAECQERFPDVSTVKDGSLVCGDCVDAHYTTCDDCGDLTPDGETSTVNGDRTVCDRWCVDNYASCDRCGETVATDWLNSAYGGNESVCESCYDYHYTWCEYCDYSVANDDSDHYHDSDESTGCCESPAQHFVMPNGAVQDETFTVTMPDGIISESGLAEIRMIVFDALRYDSNPDLRYATQNAVYYAGNEYVNKDGKFTKRITKWLHKNGGHKISEDLVSKIGQVAQKASVGGSKNIAFTRQLNLSAEDFYHEGSCWWSEYSYSRCTLKSNGGVGMRTFNDDGYVTGRAWIFPLRKDESGRLVATFDTAGADAFVVFNGYGELAESEQGRALAAACEGWVSRRVSFDPGNMYVNAGGFLVGPADVVEGAPEYLDIRMEMHSDLYRSEQNEKAMVAA